MKTFGIKEKYFFFIACALVVMNLIDAVFTLGFIEIGAATEANPLMDLLLSGGPVLFIIGKMGLVSLGVLLLWNLRHRTAAAFGLLSTAAVYFLLCGYHVTSAHMIATNYNGIM